MTRSQAEAIPNWEEEHHQVQTGATGWAFHCDSLPSAGDTDRSYSESLELFGTTVPEEKVGFLEGQATSSSCQTLAY